MRNTSDTQRLADAVANIATTIAEIIESRIREAAAGGKPAEAVRSGINMLTQAEGWVGKKQAAEHFNVSQRTFYSWMKNGVIPYVRIGRSVRFKLSAVDEVQRVIRKAFPEFVPVFGAHSDYGGHRAPRDHTIAFRLQDGQGRFRSNVVWLMPGWLATLTVADVQAMVARANGKRK